MADEAMGATTYLFEHEMKLKNALFYFVSSHSGRRRREKKKKNVLAVPLGILPQRRQEGGGRCVACRPMVAGLATNAPHDVLE